MSTTDQKNERFNNKVRITCLPWEENSLPSGLQNQLAAANRILSSRTRVTGELRIEHDAQHTNLNLYFSGGTDVLDRHREKLTRFFSGLGASNTIYYVDDNGRMTQLGTVTH